jgi:Cu/Ag efflux pump CusA
MVYVDTVVQSTGGRESSYMVEPSPKVMAEKGVSMGRLPFSS